MKIVFLSDEPDAKNAVNMSVLASSIALHFPITSYVLQHKNQNNELEKVFAPFDTRNVREESSYYALKGMDYLMLQEENDRLDRAAIEESFVSVMDNHLFYLPSGGRSLPLLNPVQTVKLESRILEKMDDYGNLIFIDGGQSFLNWPMELIQQSDLLIVNLSQKKGSLDKCFLNHINSSKVFKEKKIMYLISDYNPAAVYNVGNIRRIYRIDAENLIVVPSNEFFNQACFKGKLTGFMEKNTRRHMSGNCEYFMNEVHRSSVKILEALNWNE